MNVKNHGPWPCESDPAWKARASQAMRQARDDLDRIPRHMLDTGNPNHPMHDGIFGYDRHVFMAKQY